MKNIIVSHCCGCIKLEEGTKMIAIFWLVLGGLMLVMSVLSLSIFAIGGSIFNIAVDILLFYGTIKRLPVILMVWLVIDVVQLVLLLYAVLFTPRDAIWVGGDVYFWGGVIILTVLRIYFWVVVYSFQHEIRLGNSPNNNPVINTLT